MGGLRCLNRGLRGFSRMGFDGLLFFGGVALMSGLGVWVWRGLFGDGVLRFLAALGITWIAIGMTQSRIGNSAICLVAAGCFEY